MKAMRRRAAIGLVLLCGGAGPLTDRSTVDDVLDAMRDRGADLKAFKADVTRTEVEPNAGTITVRTGHVIYQALPGGDARLFLAFATKQKGKRPPGPYRQEYLLDRGQVTDRDYSIQQETRRQVVPPGGKLNLFDLGKGPFPLPIGQDKAKVKQLFAVVLQPPAAADPPHTLHLQLTPLPGTDFARQFDTIDFWVDEVQRMPVQIETVGFRGVSDQTHRLTNLVVNPAVGDADFTLPPAPGLRPVAIPYGQ